MSSQKSQTIQSAHGAITKPKPICEARKWYNGRELIKDNPKIPASRFFESDKNTI